MKNQYKLILNLDSINKEQYKRDYIKDGYNILIEEDNLIFVKKENDENLKSEKEDEVIEFSIKIFKKYKFKGIRVIDLSKDINSILKRVENVDKIDYKTDKQKICWQLRNAITREIAANK